MSLEDKLHQLLDYLAEEHAPYMTDYRAIDRRSAEPSLHILASFAAMARGTVVEIGTDSGLGTLGLSHGASLCWHGGWMPVQTVHTFEIIPERSQATARCHERLGTKNVVFHVRPGEEASSIQNIALAFVDADHSPEGCLSDLTILAPQMRQDGRILCHDYTAEPSNGPYEAVNRFLKANPDWRRTYLGNGYLLLHRENK
jgi:predicted O-methyltransferase YrrM